MEDVEAWEEFEPDSRRHKTVSEILQLKQAEFLCCWVQGKGNYFFSDCKKMWFRESQCQWLQEDAVQQAESSNGAKRAFAMSEMGSHDQVSLGCFHPEISQRWTEEERHSCALASFEKKLNSSDDDSPDDDLNDAFDLQHFSCDWMDKLKTAWGN